MVVQAGVPLVIAAKFIGVDYEELRRWILRGRRAKSGPYAALAAALDNAEGQFVARNLSVINKAATGDAAKEIPPDPKCAMWLLERRYPHIFGKNVQVEHHLGVPLGAQDDVIDVEPVAEFDELTEDELFEASNHVIRQRLPEPKKKDRDRVAAAKEKRRRARKNKRNRDAADRAKKIEEVAGSAVRRRRKKTDPPKEATG